jgi:predicted dehydrogenase
MSDNKLKFAIIGCGRISGKHIEALANNHDRVELVALCDVVRERAVEKAEQYRSLMGKDLSPARVYTNYEQMLAESDIDAVSLCTESGYHAEHALYALKENKHVLVEKPIALSVADADEMIAEAATRGLTLCVSHQNRFNPPVQALKEAIDEGRFGKLINGTARVLWSRDDDYYKQAPWRGTRSLDGGCLMNQCIHGIDLLLWMMGSEVERVKAETGSFIHDIEMEDYGAFTIRFKNGSIGLVEGTVCVYPRNLEETLSVFGEKGTVVIGGVAVNAVQTWDFADGVGYDKAIESEIDTIYGRGHTPLYADFISAIRERRLPLVSGEEGKKAMAVVLSAYEEASR